MFQFLNRMRDLLNGVQINGRLVGSLLVTVWRERCLGRNARRIPILIPIEPSRSRHDGHLGRRRPI
jgi:hypothetical protein